jgi:hypothetical protein
MPQAERSSSPVSTRILISVEALFGDGADAPNPHADARAAIERLGWIGQPVVVIGDEIGGRRLPCEPADRISWVRSRLGVPDVAAVVVEPDVDHAGEAADRAATARWGTLSGQWQADRLVTDRASSVAPARRAGLTVVQIGPRDPASGPPVERADLEARDLLDAVSLLMTADAFGEPAGD